MSYLFRLPKQVAIDSSGTPHASAEANFFLTGTTTATNTYSDAALTSAHANPVIADANGVFPPIYLDQNTIYKLTLNDSSQALIYTVDPVNDDFNQFGNAITTKSSNYVVVAGDRGSLLDVTGTSTITLLAAATAAAAFIVSVRNSGIGIVDVDGNGTETIDGALTAQLSPGASATYVCDGANWNSVGGGRPEEIRVKTGDESVTSSSTLQDDNQMVGFTVEVSTLYEIECFLFVTVASATPDFKLAWSFSQTPSQSQYVALSANASGTVTGDQSVMTTSVTYQIASAVDQSFFIKGSFQTHATLAGILTLQWAQGTSDGTATILKDGSWMKITRIR